MKGKNEVRIMGNIAEGAKLNYSHTDQKAIAIFSIKTSVEKHGDNYIEFIPCIAFGKVAELCAKNLKDGDRVFIDGHIQSRTVNKLGVDYLSTRVAVDELYFLERREDAKFEEIRNGNVIRRKFTDNDDAKIADKLYKQEHQKTLSAIYDMVKTLKN